MMNSGPPFQRQEEAALERAERLWLDPDWDSVYGYGDGGEENAAEEYGAPE